MKKKIPKLMATEIKHRLYEGYKGYDPLLFGNTVVTTCMLMKLRSNDDIINPKYE